MKSLLNSSLRRSTLSIAIGAAFVFFLVTNVSAQASRTWVSGVGDDANPCSRTAPCKTWAGAISKTADNGEIDALDPAGFGAVTITKSITIDGAGTNASILASLVSGVIINAAADDVVILRNLSINGFANGIHGVNFVSAGKLIIENCKIFGFATSGLNLNAATTSSVIVHDTTFYRVTTGILISGTSNNITLTTDNVRIEGNTTAISSASNAVLNLKNGLISDNTTGVLTTGGGTVNLEGILISGNTTGINAGGTSTVRMSNLSILNNTTGITRTGTSSTLASYSNNRFAGNATPGAPTAYLSNQ